MKTCFDIVQSIKTELLDISHTYLVPDPLTQSRKEYLINELINTANQLRDEFPEVQCIINCDYVDEYGDIVPYWFNLLEDEITLEQFRGVDIND